MKPVIAIHGGAGVIEKTTPQARINSYLDGLKAALFAGRRILETGGSAFDAVVAAVMVMEDDHLFNAGKGAVYTADETHELEAAVMDGLTLDAGSVCGLRHVKHPVLLARMVLEKSRHVFLSGEGAEAFGKEHDIEMVPQSYFDDEFRLCQLHEARKSGVLVRDHDIEITRPKGTVGAVALDANGNLAAATSTGGITNKSAGRVGDTSVIGAGTYANNRTCGVSCTGFGEAFIRNVAAFDVHARMQYKGLSLKHAAEEVIHECMEADTGGLIAVDTSGNVAMPFNSKGMFRGCAKIGGDYDVRIWG